MEQFVSQKSAFTVIFMALKAFLGLFINTVSVANNGVSMAEKAVSAARRRQVIDLTVSMRNYEQDAIQVASLQRLKTHLAVEDFVGQDEHKRAFLTSEQKALSSVIDSELRKLDADDAS